MADGSDSPDDLVTYWSLLEDGYDCAFGSRFIAGGRVEDYPRGKLILNRIVNTGIRLLFGHRYNDTTNAFKAYRRETIESIQPILSNHFNLTVELPLKAIVRGNSYAVVPIRWRNRAAASPSSESRRWAAATCSSSSTLPRVSPEPGRLPLRRSRAEAMASRSARGDRRGSNEMTAEDGPSPRSGRMSSALLGVSHLAAAMVATAGAVGIVGQSQTLEMVALVVGFVLVLPAVVLVMIRVGATGRDPVGLLAAAVGASGLVLGMITILRLASIIWADGMLKSIICVLFGLAAIIAVLALVELDRPCRRPAPKRASAFTDALTPSVLSFLGLAASSLVFVIFAPSQVSALAAIVALLLGAGSYVGLCASLGSSFPRKVLVLCDLACWC